MVSVVTQGGIGNVMYQIAAAYSYSLKHQMEYLIPTENIHPHLDQKPTIFPNVKYSSEIPVLPRYNEPAFTYKEIPYMPDVCLFGYYQSFKYIEPYKDEVIKILGLDDIETKKDTCSLHFRCGDYTKFPTKHPIVSEDYLRRAINYMLFSHYRKFIVFSDSMAEIKKIIQSFTWLKDVEFIYSEGNDELTDLKLMASCASNITANSAFSLWASYINPNPEKVIVSPRRWFGADLAHDTSTLYIPNSIIL